MKKSSMLKLLSCILLNVPCLNLICPSPNNIETIDHSNYNYQSSNYHKSGNIRGSVITIIPCETNSAHNQNTHNIRKDTQKYTDHGTNSINNFNINNLRTSPTEAKSIKKQILQNIHKTVKTSEENENTQKEISPKTNNDSDKIKNKLKGLYNWKQEIIKDFINEINNQYESDMEKTNHKYFYNIDKKYLKKLIIDCTNIQTKYKNINENQKDKEQNYKNELEKILNDWIENTTEENKEKLKVLCKKNSKKWINEEELKNNLEKVIWKMQTKIDNFGKIKDNQSLECMLNISNICNSIFNNILFFIENPLNEKSIERLLKIIDDIKNKILSIHIELIPTETQKLFSDFLETLNDIIFGYIVYNVALHNLNQVAKTSNSLKKVFTKITTGLTLVGLDCTKNAVIFSDIKTPIKIPYLNINFNNSLSPKFCNSLTTNKGIAKAMKYMPNKKKQVIIELLKLQQKILQKKVSIIRNNCEKQKNLNILYKNSLKDIESLRKTVYSLQLVSQIIVSLEEVTKDKISMTDIENDNFSLTLSYTIMSHVNRKLNSKLDDDVIIEKIDKEIKVLDHIIQLSAAQSTNISNTCMLLINYLNNKSLLKNFDKYIKKRVNGKKMEKI